MRAGLAEVALNDDQRELISARLDAIERAMAAAPKTTRWRMRARVGERVRWYEDPDEIEGGG